MSSSHNPGDLVLRPATELSALLTSGEVSPVELTQAFIDRAKRYARLNAYITLDEEGVYGIKCTPHYAMGMVALIEVGEATNLEDAKAVKQTGKAKEVFAELLGQSVAAK